MVGVWSWTPALAAAIECQAVGVADAGAAEEIEGATDGEIDPPTSEAFDGFQVFQRLGTAGVGHRDG